MEILFSVIIPTYNRAKPQVLDLGKAQRKTQQALCGQQLICLSYTYYNLFILK